MKTILITILLSSLSLAARSQQSIYELKIRGVAGDTLSLRSLESKKILVYVADALHPDRAYLRSLDTLHSANAINLAVIVVPATEQPGDIPDAMQRLWRDTLSSGLWIASPVEVKRASGDRQHPLMQWFSDLNKNRSSGADVRVGELFVVAMGNGRLLARIGRPIGIASPVMTRLISQ